MLFLAGYRLKAFSKAGNPQLCFPPTMSYLLSVFSGSIHCCVRCGLVLSVRVLNLSSGNEEIVDPENVWNGVPDWAYRSSEVRQCGSGLGSTVLSFRKGSLSLVVLLSGSP